MDDETASKISNVCKDLRRRILSSQPTYHGLGEQTNVVPLDEEDTLATFLLIAESVREILAWIQAHDDDEIEQNERSG